MGMYFMPDFTFPFFIMEIIIAENKEVIIKEAIAKNLKSDWDTPVPEKLNAMPALAATLDAPPKIEPRLCTTSIKTPDKANNIGAATMLAKVMNIT